MLILSRARVRVDGRGNVAVEGDWEQYTVRIAQFFSDLGLRRVTVKHRFGRFVFSGDLTPSLRQRIRNFMTNECPLKRR